MIPVANDHRGTVSLPAVHRVLIVEDHEPFRHAIRELLGHRPDVRIVGEAADGVEAIRQAEAHRPDVVLLDIGLPGLSGMAVADWLREAAPDTRVMFVTNESSVEVMESAFRRGAHGYVYKPRAQRDVLPVFDAVIRGGRFVSGGLERIERGDSLASHRHDLMFCSSDAVLVEALTRFIAGHLYDGHSVIVLVTGAHDARIRRSLRAVHVDPELAIRQGRYVPVNISELLEAVMVDGWPDTVRFLEAAGDLVAAASRLATRPSARLAACGECAPTLWAEGHIEAAIELEHLWDDFASSHAMDILCVYPLTARDAHVRAVRRLCAQHTRVEIS